MSRLTKRFLPRSIAGLLSLLTSFLYAQQGIPYADLLQGYTAGDIQLERLSIALQRKQLEMEEARIGAGLDLSLSSGSISARFLDGKSEFYAAPEASLSLPLLNNTKITGSLPLKASVSGGSVGSVSLSGGALSLSTGILTGLPEKQRITLLTAERALRTAERDYHYRHMGAEKTFLAELKKLYDLEASLNTASDELITAEEAFRLVQFQGYGETSARYRTAELSVRSKLRVKEERSRSLQRELDYFAGQCGYPDSSGIALATLPETMPDPQLLAITDFSKDLFIELENSRWTHEINGLSREAERAFTLDGSLGYKYTETAGSQSGGQSSGLHDVQAGLSMSYKGIQAGAMVSVPVNKPNSPSISVSLGWDLNTGKRTRIGDSKKALDLREEQLSITEAEDTYGTTVSDYELQRRDLLWQKTEREELLDLHTELARDMESWYQQGAVTEKDYRAAQLDMHSAILDNVKARIDRLTYNINMQLLFSEAPE
jgi:hypothetical protein